MKLKLYSAFGVTLLLSACGGSGTGSVSLEDLIARGNDFIDETSVLNVDDGTPTPADVLQTTGTASFTGVAFAFRENALDEDVTDFAALGATRVAVDFGAGEVVGTANNFYELDNADLNGVEKFDDFTGTAISGSVTYEMSQRGPGQNFYEGRIDGTLTETSGATLDIDLPSAGGFVGATGNGFVVEAFEDDNAVSFGVLALRD